MRLVKTKLINYYSFIATFVKKTKDLFSAPVLFFLSSLPSLKSRFAIMIARHYCPLTIVVVARGIIQPPGGLISGQPTPRRFALVLPGSIKVAWPPCSPDSPIIQIRKRLKAVYVYADLALRARLAKVLISQFSFSSFFFSILFLFYSIAEIRASLFSRIGRFWRRCEAWKFTSKSFSIRFYAVPVPRSFTLDRGSCCDFTGIWISLISGVIKFFWTPEKLESHRMLT